MSLKKGNDLYCYIFSKFPQMVYRSNFSKAKSINGSNKHTNENRILEVQEAVKVMKL